MTVRTYRFFLYNRWEQKSVEYDCPDERMHLFFSYSSPVTGIRDIHNGFAAIGRQIWLDPTVQLSNSFMACASSFFAPTKFEPWSDLSCWMGPWVIYQAWDAVFHHQMKHWEESWKYDAQRSIFDELQGVSSVMKHCVECLILLLKQNDFRRRN